MLAEIDLFVNWLPHRNPQTRTWRDCGYDLRQFAASIGDRPPDAVTFHDIDRFVAQQAAGGFKPATISRLAAIRTLYTSPADDDPGVVSQALPCRHGIMKLQRLPQPRALATHALRKPTAPTDSRAGSPSMTYVPLPSARRHRPPAPPAAHAQERHAFGCVAPWVLPQLPSATASHQRG